MSLHLHIDPVGGAAGDMFLAALIDLGAPADLIVNLPSRLGLPGVSVVIETTQRHQIAAHRVIVREPVNPKHRHLRHVREIIEKSDLPPSVRENALRVFQRLAEAEAKVHATEPEKVHFHEVGADDALVDIAGTCLLIHELKTESITGGALPVSHGVTKAAHGTVPLPAPATLNLAENWPLHWIDGDVELVTPTGTALITTLAKPTRPPVGVHRRTGYGAGTMDTADRPNLLRLILIDTQAAGASMERVDELVAVLDDATGQELAYAAEILLGAGALDAYYSSLVMKKGRPGWQFTVLCHPERAEALTALVLKHTPTAGVRRREIMRTILSRAFVTVNTAYGPVTVKELAGPNGSVRPAPEYDECRALALKADVPLARIQQEAIRMYWQIKGVE